MLMQFLCRALVLVLVLSQATFCALVPPSPTTVCGDDLPFSGAPSPAVPRPSLSVCDLFPLHTACKNNDLDEIVRLLGIMMEGAAQVRDELGNLPLHYSVRNRHSAAVYSLLKHSKTSEEDKVSRNKLGQAPYHMLLEEPIKRTEGATTRNAKYGEFYTTIAYLLTLDLTRVEKIVRSAKTVTDPAKKVTWKPLVAERLDCRPIFAPFHSLVLSGNKEAVERGLASGTFVVDEIIDGKYQARCDERGCTPLTALARRSSFTEDDMEIARYLLASSCNKADLLAVVDLRGFTALHHAAHMNNGAAVSFLLEAGAQPFITSTHRDEAGKEVAVRRSPFEIAFAAHSWSSIRAFINYFRAHGIAYDFSQTRQIYRPLDILFNVRINDDPDLGVSLDPVQTMKMIALYCDRHMVKYA